MKCGVRCEDTVKWEGGVAMNDKETGNYLEKDADKKHVTLDIKRRSPRHRWM